MARLSVKVTPRAARTAVIGWSGDVLRLGVTAVAERGRANAAVIALLAEVLEIAPSRLRILRGQTQSRKLIEVEGLGDAELAARLTRLATDTPAGSMRQ